MKTWLTIEWHARIITGLSAHAILTFKGDFLWQET